ncbi:MAG: (2Fe-2S)-binding protein, partial [Caulobacteraceae bacterium]|nr:(2Fe-2S)-binding protein [Caulobacter sp.]
MAGDVGPAAGGVDRRRVLTGGATAAAALPAGVALTTGRGEAAPAPPGDPRASLPIRLTINGREHQLAIDPRATLLDTLRERVGLTGSKKGCDHGQCGACTVLVDGRRVLSCLTLAATVRGSVTTVEGLAREDGPLHPMQQAFIDHDAFQCGYCTPGQILSAIACVNEGHARSDDEIRE